MKKILFFLLILLSFVSQTFAASGDSVNLQLSKNNVALNESFELKMIEKGEGGCGNISGGNMDIKAFISGNGTISMSGGSTGEVQISGMENFQIRGTSESNSCSAINGKSQSETTKVYTLIPIKSGKFTLGPVKTESSEQAQTGATVTIEVSDIPLSPSVRNLSINSGDEMVGPPSIDNPRLTPENPFSGTYNSIYIISAVLLILIGLTAWYIGRKEKEEEVGISPETTNLTETETSFQSSEDAEKYLRDYYAKESGQKTEYMTYSELLDLETDNDKKIILSDILKLLEGAHYAGGVADMNELNNGLRKLRGM